MLQMNMKQRYAAATEKLQSELGMTNSHALPKLEKIVISMGLGSCLGDKKKIDDKFVADALNRMQNEMVFSFSFS